LIFVLNKKQESDKVYCNWRGGIIIS
jgi:hypothetical protein